MYRTLRASIFRPATKTASPSDTHSRRETDTLRYNRIDAVEAISVLQKEDIARPLCNVIGHDN
jgi:hypothetical protein